MEGSFSLKDSLMGPRTNRPLVESSLRAPIRQVVGTMAQKMGWLIPRHKLEKGGDSFSTYSRVVRPRAASPSLVPSLVPLFMHLGGSILLRFLRMTLSTWSVMSRRIVSLLYILHVSSGVFVFLHLFITRDKLFDFVFVVFLALLCP